MAEEIHVLGELHGVALAQHEAARAGRHADLAALVRQREGIEGALAQLEVTLLPLRKQLLAPPGAPASDAGIVTELHDRARTLISAVLALDRETHDLLVEARGQRTTRFEELAAGEATLAAYRRAVAGRASSAELIDQVG